MREMFGLYFESEQRPLGTYFIVRMFEERKEKANKPLEEIYRRSIQTGTQNLKKHYNSFRSE